MSRSKKALKAFYGARDAGAPSRPGEIFTPVELVQPLIDVWGSIELDPCAHRDSPTSALARERWYGEPTVWDDGLTPTAWTGRGLTDPWWDRTYCNPPFSELRKWLECAAYAAALNRIAVLMPARLQRPWLRSYLRGRVVVALNSVRFHGYDQAFPQALLMVISGPDAFAVGVRYEASGLGEVLSV